eukprot:1241122-Pyramimonas_sp.AAC.1
MPTCCDSAPEGEAPQGVFGWVCGRRGDGDASPSGPRPCGQSLSGRRAFSVPQASRSQMRPGPPVDRVHACSPGHGPKRDPSVDS